MAPQAALTAPSVRRYTPIAAVGVAAFGAFLAFMDSTVVNVAFPNIAAAFPHATIAELSWILNGYNIAFAGLLVVAGRFADLLGRRRLFKVGLLIFTLTSGLCAASSSVTMLVLLRVAQGAGAAVLVPASLGVVVHASTDERRSHLLSLCAAAGALAAGLGPPIGGALVDVYNWRLVFLVNVPLGLLAWALANRVVIESRAPGRRLMPDMPGALALSVALASATVGIVQGSSWGWASPATLAAFGVAAGCGALTALRSRWHPSPVLDPALLSIRAFSVSNLVVTLAGLGLFTYLLTHILWLHYVWGYSLLLAGLAVAPGAVVAAITAGPFGALADRFGTRAVAVPGALVWGAAFVWYATQVGSHPDFLGEWLPGQLMSGVGVGATLPVATAGGLSTVPARRYATAAAVTASTRQFGGVLGIALLTVFIAHATPTGLPAGLRHGWELAAGSFFAAAGVGLFFGRVRAGGEASGTTSPAPALSHPNEPSLLAAPPDGGTNLLALLPPPVREAIMASGEQLRLQAGAVLFNAGDPGDALYLVQSGRLEVKFPDGSGRDLPAGAAVGELALLTDSTRSATVVARRDSTLHAISRDRFDELAAAQPAVVSAVAQGLAHLLQASRPVSPSVPAAPKVVALVALDAHVPIHALADAVHLGLAYDGRGHAGPEAPAWPRRIRVARLDGATPEVLERAEGDNDRVLLVAGPTGSWHDASLRQADWVIAAASSPLPSIELGLRCPIDIVLTGTAPTQAQIVLWHDALAGCRRVHHIGSDPEQWQPKLRPLLDRLASRSIALVLAGGGAKALAHLGVLHAFENAGVEANRVAGTSMGAFIGALYATGRTASAIDVQVFEEFVRRKPFSDYRPSFTSLARGERGRAMLRRCFGEIRLEETAREIVVASTDLYEGTTVYHRRGLLREVVGASMSLPVLFPPRYIDGRALVDGCLSDNCPVTPVTEHAEGPVVAVQIKSGGGGSKLDRVPSLGETLLRVMQMGEKSAEDARDVATVTVTPDTSGVGLLEFHQIDEAREAGLQAGEAAVRSLRELGWARPIPLTGPGPKS